MRGLDREGDPLGLAQIPFFSYFGCKPFRPESAQRAEPQLEGLTPGDVPGHRAARVVARFGAPGSTEADPAIVERPFGDGRVVLVTTTADKEWHHWPDHPTFLPVIMELTRHVARRTDSGLSHHVGDAIELPLDGALFEPDAVIRTPAYPNERETSVTAVMTNDGRGLRLRWERTDRPGIYRFLVRRREGGESALLSAVNIDPQESDLTLADEAELRRALGDVPFEYINGIDALTEVGADARVELWRLFLFAAVAFLMTEQVLAWWWGRRR
jgi:hypothetical protein